MENNKDWMYYTKGIAEIVLIIATLYYGNIIASDFKDKEIKLETLKVAIDILDKNPTKGEDSLRKWAIVVFKQYADPKPPPEVLDVLRKESLKGKDYMTKLPLDKDNEDGSAPVITEHKFNLDGTSGDEYIKVIYGQGVSDKALTIEVYIKGKLVSVLKGDLGIQSNYRVVDDQGKKDIIIWSGLWDPRLPGEDGITEATYEGHSAPHRYIVATYKLIRGTYCLWDIYTTKRKYDPFCERQPEKD